MGCNKISLFSLVLSTLVVFSSCTLPVIISPIVISESGNNVCSSNDQIEARLNVTKEEVKQAIINTVTPFLNQNLTSTPCGGSGWRRVAFLDMSDPSATCPGNWMLHTSPRGCGRAMNSNLMTCDSAVYPVNGQTYSAVCGRILAYQRGTTDAFYSSIRGAQTTIDSAYVDGVSITHGSVGSRQHIWTFAVALYENDPSFLTDSNCACTNNQYSWPFTIPTFIQNRYFCDTGNPGPGFGGYTYYPNNPLWDGAGCGPTSTCCQFNNPPWFQSTLPQGTTDDIELRICHGELGSDEDTVVNLVEIYVQ